MTFMNDRPAGFDAAVARRPDGSVDREHYEAAARRERAIALGMFWKRLLHFPTSGRDGRPSVPRSAYRQA